MVGVGDRSPWEVARKRGHGPASPPAWPVGGAGARRNQAPGNVCFFLCTVQEERPAGHPLRLMLARPGGPTSGLASGAFRQGHGRIPVAPAAQDTGLETGVGWASSRTGQGPPGRLGPSLSPPLLPGDPEPQPPSQACGPEPSGRRGWPHMCTISLHPQGVTPTPRRLAQGVLITHTNTPRESPPSTRRLAQGGAHYLLPHPQDRLLPVFLLP